MWKMCKCEKLHALLACSIKFKTDTKEVLLFLFWIRASQGAEMLVRSLALKSRNICPLFGTLEQ